MRTAVIALSLLLALSALAAAQPQGNATQHNQTAAQPAPGQGFEIVPSGMLPLLMLAAGVAVGLSVGSSFGSRERVAGRFLTQGDALAIVFDVTTDTVAITPVERAGESVYMSRDGSLMLLTPTLRVSKTLKPFNKPVFLAFGTKTAATAVSPEALASVGIAAMSLDGIRLDSGSHGVQEVVEGLLSREVAPLSGKIPVSGDMTLAIAFSPPALARNVLLLTLEPAEAAVKVVLDAIQFSERMQQLMIEQLRARAALAGAWVRWLILALVAGGVVALMFYALGR